MQTQRALRVLNPLLGLALGLQLFTGLFAEDLPGWAGEVHEVGGIVLGLGVVLHVILNWGWIRVNYLSRRRA